MRRNSLPIPPVYQRISAKLPPHPWPYAPVLELPAGSLRNHECGRLITAGEFVLAVGLSPQHFLVVMRAPGTGNIAAVLEQAVGFLCARGATVLRVELRCRAKLFMGELGKLDWRRCLVYFVRQFLSDDPTLPPDVPADVWHVAPVSVVAAAGRSHWREVEQVMQGVEASDPELLPEVASALASMAGRWERHLARQIVLAERYGQYEACDQEFVSECDRQLSQLMSRYAPGQELFPPTLARML